MGCGSSSPQSHNEKEVSCESPQRREDIDTSEAVLPCSRPSTVPSTARPLSSTIGSVSTGLRSQPSLRLNVAPPSRPGPVESAARGPRKSIVTHVLAPLPVRRDTVTQPPPANSVPDCDQPKAAGEPTNPNPLVARRLTLTALPPQPTHEDAESSDESFDLAESQRGTPQVMDLQLPPERDQTDAKAELPPLEKAAVEVHPIEALASAKDAVDVTRTGSGASPPSDEAAHEAPPPLTRRDTCAPRELSQIDTSFTASQSTSTKTPRPRSGLIKYNGAKVGSKTPLRSHLTPSARSLLPTGTRRWSALEAEPEDEADPFAHFQSQQASREVSAEATAPLAAGEGQSMRLSIDSELDLGLVPRRTSSNERRSSALSTAVSCAPFRTVAEEELMQDLLRSVDKRSSEPAWVDTRLPLNFCNPRLVDQTERSMSSKRLTGRPQGAVLCLPDAGDRLPAVAAVLVALESYAMMAHRRMLCDLFSYVIASGSSGHIALSLSQGDDMKSVLQRLKENAPSLLRPKPISGGFHAEMPFTGEMTLKLSYDAAGIPDADRNRRMCHQYRRGEYRVAWPCFVAVDEFGTALRIVDWNSRLEAHEVGRMASNTYTSVQHGDTRYAAATSACPDPALLASIIDPVPSLVCRVSIDKEGTNGDGDDDAISAILTKLLGEGFVDIVLPVIEDLPPAEGAFGKMLQEPVSNTNSVSSQWLLNDEESDTRRIRQCIEAGDEFVMENDEVLQQVVDLLAARATSDEGLSPCITDLLDGI